LKIFPNINPSFSDENTSLKIHCLDINNNCDLNDSNYRFRNYIMFAVHAEGTALENPLVSILDKAMEEEESPCPSCQCCLIQ